MLNEVKQSTNNGMQPVAIIGTGPIGLLAALILSPLYEDLTLIGPQLNTEDGRTSALMMPAIRQLDQLGLWESLQHDSAALSGLRIIDSTQRLIRAPTVIFRAAEIGEAAFGYNIPNKLLNKILWDKVKSTPNIICCPYTVKNYQHESDGIAITLNDETRHKVALIIAADGRNSPARKAAGIKTHQWRYPQKALVLNFSHQESHQNISTEFHTSHGPFTQVPLPGNRSSLVWVLNPTQADHLLGLGCVALATEIENNMGSMLGKITLDQDSQDWPPQVWPMGTVILSRFAAKRTFLIGEAAHVFPPIGAQGLNLGFRDIADLEHVLRSGDKVTMISRLIHDYNRRRRADIWARTGFVHMLNQTLLSNFLPAQLLRNTGMEALQQLPALRNLIMREGLAPGNGIQHLLPRLPFFKGSSTSVFKRNRFS